MSPTSLYTVRHLQLREAIEDPLRAIGPGKWYTVFWWDDIPLGHLFEETNKPPVPAETKKLIWKAIAPAIAYYSAKSNCAVSCIEKIFYGDNLTELLSLFERFFAPHSFPPEKELPAVSLVICTRNRLASLQKCLDSLSQLHYPPAEVIVVDNAPDDDRTEKLVATRQGIRYVPEPEKGLDRARNAGIAAAGSPIIAFMDDDVELHPDWIRRMAENFEDPAVQAVTSLVLPVEIATRAQYYFEKYWSFNRGYQPLCYDGRFFKDHLQSGVPVWEIGAGAGMAFRKTIFDVVGGFNIWLDAGAAGCNGDSEMWYRLLAEGWAIHYDPAAVAFHQHRREMPAFRQQIYQYMRGFSAAILTEYRLYRNPGELRHLFRVLPSHYLRSLWKTLKNGRNEQWVTLRQETAGWLAGICYYLAHRKQIALSPVTRPDLPPAHTNGLPLVSVIITTYNHYRYLPDAIGSVLQQRYKNIELIVVDDGSTDPTPVLMKAYLSVKYVRQPNQGLAAARNTGVVHSKGAFILFLDADDWLYPDAVGMQLRQFHLHQAVAFVAGSHDKVSDTKEILPIPESAPPVKDHYAALLTGNFIGMHAAVMYRREVFDYFRFDTNLRACEDYDLYLRITRLFSVGCHSGKIAAYRIHDRNMSADAAMMFTAAGEVLRKQCPLLPGGFRNPLYRKGLQIWKTYYDNAPAQPVSNMEHGNLKKTIKKILPESVNRRLCKWRGLPYLPPEGKIAWGDLKRNDPFSREFGYDRGGPADRYYIECFLENHSAFIRGCVLEVGDNAYTMRFGGKQVTDSDVLHIDPANPAATIIGDLAALDHVENNRFDCIILTQTLHLIYDFRAALQTCNRILKQDGVLLLTVPGITNIDYGEWGNTWYWSFTPVSIARLLSETFGNPGTKVQSFGNLLAATTFLYGAGANEISREEKDFFDPHYPVIIAACAAKKEV